MFIAALLYLALPVFIILFTFFSMPFVIPSAVALIILIFCLNKQRVDLSSLPHKPLVSYWPLLLMSILTPYLCVVGFEVPDWRNFFAIFNSLSESAWPPVLELDEQTWFLRYYASWFVMPALLAKILGSQFLLVAMFIWTAIGVFVALLIAFHNLHKASFLFIAASVFFIFSGLDIVGAYLVNYTDNLSHAWLGGWGGHRLFIVLSNLTTFHHAPQHAVAAFVSTSLIFCNRRLGLQYGAFILVIITMWSPFCAVGLLPLVMWSLYKEGFKTALTPQNLLVAPLLAMPIVLYLSQGTEQIPHMFAWQHANFSFISLILFCILEFLLILAILYYFLKEDTDRHIIFVLAAFLTLLCTYNVGLYTDLLIRGSMPAICVMSILMAKAVLSNRGWQREILVTYMIIGAIPVVSAFAVGVSNTMPKTYRYSTFKQYLNDRAAEDREIHRSQNLVEIKSARYIGNIPLMRNFPFKN